MGHQQRSGHSLYTLCIHDDLKGLIYIAISQLTAGLADPEYKSKIYHASSYCACIGLREAEFS